MSDQPMQICTAFMKIIELAEHIGVQDIKSFGVPWTHFVDEHWTVAVNGQDRSCGVYFTNDNMPRHMDLDDLPRYHAAVWFNGWLAGIFSPVGGTFAAGTAANEETFAAAIDAATKEVE